MKLLHRLTDSWVDHPLLDYFLLLIPAAVAIAINPVSTIRPGDHGTWYQTLTGVSGVLLSLGTIVITLILTVTPTDRFERLLAAVGPRLLRITIASLSGLVVTTGGFAGLFLLEQGVDHKVRVGVTVGLATLMMTSFGRLWWMLRRILAALVSVDRPDKPAAAVGWQKPVVQPEDYALPLRPDTASEAG